MSPRADSFSAAIFSFRKTLAPPSFPLIALACYFPVTFVAFVGVFMQVLWT